VFLVVFIATIGAPGWQPATRDAAAGNAIQKESVPSNIISVEPVRPATGIEPETTKTTAPEAPAAPAATTLPEVVPETLRVDLNTSEPAAAAPAPSPDIAPLETAARESPDQEIQRAMAANDHRKLIQLAGRSPDQFSCAHVDRAWSLAAAHAALGQADALSLLLASLIDTCGERDRLATLQKAESWLDANDWEELAERESGNPRTPEVEAEFLRARYDHDVNLLLAAGKPVDHMEFSRRFERLSAGVERYQDANIALVAGWSFLAAGNTGNAVLWFGKARDWQPAETDAARGLALAALAEQRHADARLLAEGLPAGSEGREEILRNALVGMARAEYDQDNHAAALKLLDDAGPTTALPRYARLMKAWSLLHLGNSTQALELFQAVHLQEPDTESATGIFNALVATGDTAALDQYSGDNFLAPLLQRYRAEQFFAQKRFLAARDLAPDTYGSSGGAGAPRAAWHGMLRDKSGTIGLSKLEDTVNSLEAAWPVSGRSELTFRIDHHQLDSGQFGREARLYLAGGLLNGVLGIANDAPAFALLAEAGADSLRVSGAGADVSIWEPHLTWRNEARFDIEADIGASAIGSVLDPHFIGSLSVRDSNKWGNFAITGYAKPLRESILSYTGWRLDGFLPVSPLNGVEWGGVRAVGAEVSGYVPLGSGFGFSGKLALEQIDAKNVRENSHQLMLAGLNYGLDLEGFDYFAAGVSAAYDHYEHNLSQFTPGHGGYFSPQTFWQYKANLDFLTLENRRALVKGHLDGGRVLKREGATPIIPLDGFDEQGFFPGNREWGWAYSVELNGALRINNHVQLGAHLSRRESPQYDETAGMLFIRVLFEPRNSVLSSDLPGRVVDQFR